MGRGQKILISISLLGNILLCAVAIQLWGTGLEYYKRELNVRLDPLDSQRENALWKGKKGAVKIVFLGDSRAEQWPAPKIDCEYLNLGISNQTSTQILLRSTEQLKNVKPDIIVIQAGVNDLKAISLMPNQRKKIMDSTLKNLDQIVIEAEKTGAIVLLTTVFPAGNPSILDRARWNAESESAIFEVNQLLRKRYPNLLDAAELLSQDGKKLNNGKSKDLLHLNENGYQILNQELAKRISPN